MGKAYIWKGYAGLAAHAISFRAKYMQTARSPPSPPSLPEHQQMVTTPASLFCPLLGLGIEPRRVLVARGRRERLAKPKERS
jgi:hypothetical protein